MPDCFLAATSSFKPYIGIHQFKFERKFGITSGKQFKGLNNWFDKVKLRDNGVLDTFER